jgi:hypothetical protein
MSGAPNYPAESNNGSRWLGLWYWNRGFSLRFVTAVRHVNQLERSFGMKTQDFPA